MYRKYAYIPESVKPLAWVGQAVIYSAPWSCTINGFQQYWKMNKWRWQASFWLYLPMSTIQSVPTCIMAHMKAYIFFKLFKIKKIIHTVIRSRLPWRSTNWMACHNYSWRSSMITNRKMCPANITKVCYKTGTGNKISFCYNTKLYCYIFFAAKSELVSHWMIVKSMWNKSTGTHISS